jgi:hypothetical protein
MEMQRGLKVAIQDLAAETVSARRSANRGAVILVVLTAALVALTVVLALKGLGAFRQAPGSEPGLGPALLRVATRYV